MYEAFNLISSGEGKRDCRELSLVLGVLEMKQGWDPHTAAKLDPDA